MTIFLTKWRANEQQGWGFRTKKVDFDIFENQYGNQSKLVGSLRKF